MAAVRIRIGAAADSSMATVFRPLVNAAKQAKKQLDSDFRKAGVRMGGHIHGAAKSFAAVQSASQKAASKILSDWQKTGAAAQQASNKVLSDWQKTAQKEQALAEKTAAKRVAAEHRASAKVLNDWQKVAAKEQALAEKTAAKRLAAEQHATAKVLADWQKIAAKKQALAEKTAKAVQKAEQKRLASEKAASAKALDDYQKAAQKKTAVDAAAEARRLALVRKTNAAVLSEYQRIARAEARAAAAREAGFRRASRMQEREAAKAARMQAAAARHAERASTFGGGSRFGMYASSALMRNLSGVRNRAGMVGRDIARGYGVDFNLGSSIQRNVELESAAVRISNLAYLRKGGPLAGKRAAPGGIEEMMRTTGAETGTAPEEIAAGMERFIGMSSDLALGKALIGDMAKFAKAAGAELEDVLTFAGAIASQYDNVSQSSKEIAERAKYINLITRAAGGAAKYGTVEMLHLASKGPRFVAAAEGIGTDRALAMNRMLAIGEMGIKGGSTTAPEAAMSVARFVSTFRKNARIEAFEKIGVNPYTEEGLLRDPKETILAALKATKADPGQMNTLWMDTRASRAVEGPRLAYVRAKMAAGGGEAGDIAGLKAVSELFDKFEEGVMTVGEVQTSFGNTLDTAKAKGVQFQVQLDRLTQKMQTELLPNLVKLAPVASKVFDAFTKLVGFTAAHPVAAGVLGIAGAGAGSVAEAAIRVGVERGLAKVNWSGLGGAAAGLGVLAVAVTAWSAGKLAIEWAASETDKGQNKEVLKGVRREEAKQKIMRDVESGELSPEQGIAKLEALRKETDQEIRLGRERKAETQAIENETDLGDDGDERRRKRPRLVSSDLKKAMADFGEVIFGEKSAEQIGKEQIAERALAENERQSDLLGKLITAVTRLAPLKPGAAPPGIDPNLRSPAGG